MRFISAATRAKYTVAGHPKYMEMRGSTPIPHPGLQARFFGHVFDSEKSQRELGWTEDERKEVEDYLLAHRDFNRPGGFYLENVGEASRPVHIKAGRCIAFFINEHGESEQCPNEPAGDTDYCGQHLPEMLEKQEEAAEV